MEFVQYLHIITRSLTQMQDGKRFSCVHNKGSLSKCQQS